MKIVHINTFSYKATGTIMFSIHNELIKKNVESYAVWSRGRNPIGKYEISIGDSLGVKFHGIYTRITDRTGFASKNATKRLLQELNKIKPDIIQLHSLHGYYINIEMLFDYIKQNKIKVVWTLHDCWGFTGHCAYFDAVRCSKWKTGCYECCQKNTYPASYIIDNSKKNWEDKRNVFTGVDMTIVTPCNWLKGLVKKSFLSEYNVETIYNGIDTDIFKHTESDFRERNGLKDSFIILGVAGEWTKRKGLDDFISLNKIIEKDYRNIKIVLVGLNKKQIKNLPRNILGLERTSSAIKLAEIYSAADVFFNPTYEDNYPTTNLESIACGTPVVTYDTGGSPEGVLKGNGEVIEKGNFRYIYNQIGKFKKVYFDEKDISKHTCVDKYIKLYERILKI